MTESLAYKIIRRRKRGTAAYQKALSRPGTKRSMAYARAAATDADGNTPPESKIWASTRHKDTARNIRFFLWMMLHDDYKVGYYWEKITGSENWGKCSKCGVTESMQHILTQCTEPGQSQVWELASELWRLKTRNDLKPTLGEIMACGAIEKSDMETPERTSDRRKKPSIRKRNKK